MKYIQLIRDISRIINKQHILFHNKRQICKITTHIYYYYIYLANDHDIYGEFAGKGKGDLNVNQRDTGVKKITGRARKYSMDETDDCTSPHQQQKIYVWKHIYINIYIYR